MGPLRFDAHTDEYNNEFKKKTEKLQSASLPCVVLHIYEFFWALSSILLQKPFVFYLLLGIVSPKNCKQVLLKMQGLLYIKNIKKTKLAIKCLQIIKIKKNFHAFMVNNIKYAENSSFYFHSLFFVKSLHLIRKNLIKTKKNILR